MSILVDLNTDTDGGTLVGGTLGTREALALRVAELSAVCKQQRDELDEQRSVLDMSRKQLRSHEEIIRNQEARLIERDAQLQAALAEIRALKRQHVTDAEALRHAHEELSPRRRGGSPTTRSPRAPQSPSKAASSSAPSSKELRKQLQQTLADKVVLVRALHQLTAEMAQARADVRKHAESAERSLTTAWRLGQLGQLGLQMLEMGEEGAPPFVGTSGGGGGGGNEPAFIDDSASVTASETASSVGGKAPPPSADQLSAVADQLRGLQRKWEHLVDSGQHMPIQHPALPPHLSLPPHVPPIPPPPPQSWTPNFSSSSSPTAGHKLSPKLVSPARMDVAGLVAGRSSEQSAYPSEDD